MPKLICTLPHTLTLACSGGIDSMVAANFLLAGRKKLTLAYFNHGTEYAPKAEQFVLDWGNKNNCEVLIGKIQEIKNNSQSWEEYWRNQRYNWLHSLPGTVLTAHHLDDAVESWIFYSLRGNPKLIPIQKDPNVVRPFLLWGKQEMRDFAKKKNVEWIDDPSNEDMHYSRNRIRNRIMPEALEINPGLRTTIKNLYLKGERYGLQI